jgi:hypothetical protein
MQHIAVHHVKVNQITLKLQWDDSLTGEEELFASAKDLKLIACFD